MSERDYRADILVATAWGTLLVAIPIAVWWSIDHLIARLAQ